MPSDFDYFAGNISSLKLNETEKAIACLWYNQEHGSLPETCVNSLAKQLEQAGLAGNVNLTRLRSKLRQSRRTVRGNDTDSFRISPVVKASLDDEYQPLVKRRKIQVGDDLLPQNIMQNTRKYLQDLAHQINGTYDVGFYDACAVMCRRIIEILLIEVFNHSGHLAAIKKSDGTLELLETIVNKAKSGNYIHLPRGTAKNIDKVKAVGDTAAHDRYHITTRPDIDDFKIEFRKTISQLLGLSGGYKN